jgi:asparagine N-glycosylation enzyme membrane subunit Stt3
VYFAGVMVRLMLVLAPVMCILGGIAVSASLSTYMKYLEGSGEYKIIITYFKRLRAGKKIIQGQD